MMNIICQVLYSILIIVLPMIFSLNGFGIDTWQWWTLFLGILAAYIIGMLRMVDFE